MNDKNLMQGLRAGMAHEIATAPRQHRLRTPHCPPLTRFTSVAQWSDDENTHMACCPYCRMVLRWLEEDETAHRCHELAATLNANHTSPEQTRSLVEALPANGILAGADQRCLAETEHPVIGLAELWHSHEAQVWDEALKRYWQFVQTGNLALERALDVLDLSRIEKLDPQGWYDFLFNEYFRWKYTAANRYATTTRRLRQYAESGALDDLHRIKERLLDFDQTDIREGLLIAREIKGLGVAGASGLLSLMYPAMFGTVDQFVVKALRCLPFLPEAAVLAKLKPEALTTEDGVLLIGIMRRKAAENSRLLTPSVWTPRMVDKILWTYGR